MSDWAWILVSAAIGSTIVPLLLRLDWWLRMRPIRRWLAAQHHPSGVDHEEGR